MYRKSYVYTALQFAVSPSLDTFKIGRNIHIYSKFICVICLRVNGTRVRQKHIHHYYKEDYITDGKIF